jgi:protein CpxP
MNKHIIIAAGLLFAGAAVAQDRQQRSPEELAKARTERLTTVLELTPEQAAKVQALHLKHAQEAEAQRARMKAEREAKRAEMAKKREQQEAELKAILTAEQYTKWQAMREQRKEGMEKRKSDSEENKEKREQMNQGRKR